MSVRDRETVVDYMTTLTDGIAMANAKLVQVYYIPCCLQAQHAFL